MTAELHTNAIVDIYERLTALETQVTNLLLDATVHRVYDPRSPEPPKSLIDVNVNGMILEQVPYLTMRAGDGKTYWHPSVGESGILLVPSGDVGNARFLPAQYTQENPPPENDPDTYHLEWKDGSKVTHDAKTSTHQLQVQSTTRTTTPVQIEDVVGAAKREATPTAITDSLGPISLKMTATGLVITAPTVNIVGVLQVGGVPLIVR